MRRRFTRKLRKMQGKLSPPVGIGADEKTVKGDNAELIPGNSTIELKDNTIVVVFGASGDLAKKKTVSFETLWAAKPQRP